MSTADKWPRGCIQIYTGDGKGKTTAALGLALRAVGAGLRVYIGQFIKGRHYSELDGLAKLGEGVDIQQFGEGRFLFRDPTPADCAAALRGLETVRRVFEEHRHQVVILDEANVAVRVGLIDIDALLALVEAKPADVELILTGRNAHPRLVERADLVTEMHAIKHYYSTGLQARTGIEK
ncbi:MAG: cob(I)yrinic acid a,c-diamide adenosyltransferase [Verrucomicrobiota bacterium]